MTKIALLGAGGKMGVRLSTNLKAAGADFSPVEVTDEGRKRLRDATGLDCIEQGQALSRADVVVLAVPDRAIGSVAHQIVGGLESGTSVVMLDAAAPHAGDLPERDDIAYFVTHPCHPPIFNDEEGENRLDFFGGVKAKQHIVCALMQGSEEDYAKCEVVAKQIYAPVMRSHRVTVEQMAILEPALSETVGATLALALREATDEAVRRGVPEQAAHDFMLGHLNIELAIAFGIFPEGRFSDGALKAIEKAKPLIFRDGWRERVFDPEAVMASVKDICEPDGA